MFKKLRSNRNPTDTIPSQIKQEFSIYFERLEQHIIAYLIRYPSLVFKIMVALIVISTIFTLPFFKPKISNPKSSSLFESPFEGENGLDDLLDKGRKLKETIVLNKEIESIVNKPILSKTDSIKLISALSRLELLNKAKNK